MNRLPETSARWQLPQDYNEPDRHAFCVLPWVHRFINLGGEEQLCCTAEEHPESYIRGDDGRRLNVVDAYSDEALGNTRHMRNIRLDMLRGKWPAACERCRVTELTGGVSRRCSENGHFEQHIDWILENTDHSGVAPGHIRSRDYRLGNLCNLRCRMCHPNASKLMLPEWNQVSRPRHRIGGSEAERIEHMDWFRSADLWEEFERNVGQLEHLHFAGGEPLVIPEVLKALRICVENGAAGQIELTFNTNLTKLPREHLELWPRFKAVRLLCSVDAYGPLNDYIRYPAKWKKIEEHLDFIDREHERLNLASVRLSATVQIYNIFHLQELFDYTRRRYRFINPMPQLVHLAVPAYYNVQILPGELKRLAAERLQDLRATLATEGFPDGVRHIDAMLAYMKLGRHRSGLTGEFVRVTRAYDALRGERLQDLVPELTELMEASGVVHRLELAVDNARYFARRALGRAKGLAWAVINRGRAWISVRRA